MQVLHSSVARPWKLEQNTSGQASRQASRASRLFFPSNAYKLSPGRSPRSIACCISVNYLIKAVTLSIFTEGGLQKKNWHRTSYGNWSKTKYDKEGALFWTSKREKKQARKNGPPQYLLRLAVCCIHQWELMRLWKSAVHRSEVRSNASSKFLQDYAGRRVRQTRTPNASAEHVVANLIELAHCRVKKTVSPSTPTCWRRTPSFRSRRNTISHRETQTQQTKKQRTKQQEKTKRGKEKMCSLCRSVVLYQVRWHCSSCSLNELLTPLPWADVSTGKLDSRFPVNKPQVLQIKVCWNNSSCYKSTQSPSDKNIETLPKVLKANWFSSKRE